MYPEVFVKFARSQQAWDDIEVLPSPQFFFGMEKGEEITNVVYRYKRGMGWLKTTHAATKKPKATSPKTATRIQGFLSFFDGFAPIRAHST